MDDKNIAKDIIKQVVSKIEILEERKNEISNQMKEVYDEAKFHCLDVTILKQLIRLRKKKKEDVEEAEELLKIYSMALES